MPQKEEQGKAPAYIIQIIQAQSNTINMLNKLNSEICARMTALLDRMIALEQHKTPNIDPLELVRRVMSMKNQNPDNEEIHKDFVDKYQEQTLDILKRFKEQSVQDDRPGTS